MKVIVVGCGKFGIRVAEYLIRQNHDVTVIDNNREAFHAFSEEFTGRTICGVGYDRDVLEQAGVSTSDVLISCASSDSLNAVIASVAKNMYHVPTVIARMYDPVRAKMFESMESLPYPSPAWVWKILWNFWKTTVTGALYVNLAMTKSRSSKHG